MLAGMIQASRTEKYDRMREMLNEKQWRHFLALEAQERGSVMQVAQEARVSHNTIRRGLRELEAGERYSPGDRQRKKGGEGNKQWRRTRACLMIWKAFLNPRATR